MKREEGFSLIEVIVALGLLGFILLSLAQLFMVAMYTENAARRHTTLTFQAQRQMELLTSLPMTDPRLNPYVLPACDHWDAACWARVDPDHRWPPNSLEDSQIQVCRCFMVWEVQPMTPTGPRVIRLLVVPHPPTIGLTMPQVLIGVAYP